MPPIGGGFNLMGVYPVTLVRAGARSNNLPFVTLATDQVVPFATGSIACGQFNWNASNWEYGTYGTYVFAATLWVSGATPAIGCTVQLYNVTDGEAVTLGVLTTTSNTPTYLTANLTCGAGAGLLKTSAKMYEVRVTLTGGADPTDTAYVGSCRLQQTVA
jgi:hypothetical protein